MHIGCFATEGKERQKQIDREREQKDRQKTSKGERKTKRFKQEANKENKEKYIIAAVYTPDEGQQISPGPSPKALCN